jgi:O-antigen/teichoic acid export membrane protein
MSPENAKSGSSATGETDPPSAGRVARGVLWLATSGVVVKGVQTVVLLVLAALLAPSALGVIAIGSLVFNASALITEAGASTALVYWRGDALRAARTTLTIVLTTGVAMTAISWIIAPWLANTLHTEGGAAVIRGLTSTIPFYAVASVTLELLRRELAFARRIIPDVVAATVGAAVSVVLAVAGHGVAALVIGQIVQGVLTLLLSWVVGARVRPGWNREDARGLLGYGGHLAGGNMLQLVLLNVDYLIVARVLGATALGEYSLAFRLAYLPYLNVAFVISGAAFPYLCRVTGPALGRATELVTASALMVLAPLCLGIALFANKLRLLGDKWAPAVPAARWLALYALLLSVAQLAQTPVNAVGQVRSTLKLRLLHLVALVVSLVLLAPHGITAVAIGQVVAVTATVGVSIVVAQRYIPALSLRRLAVALGPCAAGMVAMAFVVLGVQHWYPSADSSTIGFVLLGLFGVAAYATVLWSLDRATIIRTFRLIRTPT